MLSSVATKEGGLPEGAASYCLAPVILDTPMNRKFMPKADTTKWTPLSYVAEKFQSWAEQPDQRPKNGSGTVFTFIFAITDNLSLQKVTFVEFGLERLFRFRKGEYPLSAQAGYCRQRHHLPRAVINSNKRVPSSVLDYHNFGVFW
jgi:hypothetical protein